MTISPEKFERLVEEACQTLPGWVDELIQEAGIAIYAVDSPPQYIQQKFGPHVRGLFTGRNYSSTQSHRATSIPTRIEIYRKPLIRQLSTRRDNFEGAVREQVRKTIVHEIGHYLGMDEEELRKRGY